MPRGKGSKKGKSSKGFNQKKTDDFLEINGRKDNIHTTDSGLQYEIVEESCGDVPDDNCRITVHQRIKLIDGTIIADTYKSNAPESFDMDEAIDGYMEGLKLMNEGSRYRFFIPPELAWGNRGAGTKIGPYALIIIDCRLISIE